MKKMIAVLITVVAVGAIATSALAAPRTILPIKAKLSSAQLKTKVGTAVGTQQARPAQLKSKIAGALRR